MSYAETFARDLRLAILRSLDELPPGVCSDSFLIKRLRMIYHPATRDQVDGAVVWLAEQGLLRLEITPGVAPKGLVLLERGSEVACGRAMHPGVDSPSRPRY